MNKKIKIISLTLLLTATFALPLSGCSQKTTAATTATSSSTDQTSIAPTYKDVVFASVNNDNGDKKDLKMNIFKPQVKTEATPVLVYIHGGGWAMSDYQGDDAPKDSNAPKAPAQNQAGQPTGQMSGDNTSSYKIFKSILNNGIAFVSIDYRLNSEAAFPAQIYDVKGAIRYIRAHAKEYGLDPDKIAVCGTSAGAHLAAELATTGDIKELEGDEGGNLDYSSKVMACVDFYGPTDLLTMSNEMDPLLQSHVDAVATHDSTDSNESKLLGFTQKGQGIGVLREIRDKNETNSPYWDKVKLAELASPVNNVTSDDPPMFIAHGGHDTLVPIQQSLRLRDALIKAGIENIFMSNSKAPHGYQGEDVNKAALTWVTNKLLAK
ncbi:acetyl esterase/lipase [Clostridium saccharoperbutylacetonicum]|uniref:Esterase/lipase n=2 Tax=Clostridium TaxID=1485 RepID=M1LUG2_9CLOT|nr:alpha/beta hydrolase [Clostridium saccharoperbutylacetonicum]AGF56705.1 esterase/lipase [Clostridium saccharoperbutylacetonicum N1-4(HMT)]NRT62540.1 acetyl esterase/lipase [Clostridium saccharoperbutylacetonicum]NSB25886.1 acetyl esterase/lipase [Clostridium saccharoperbutylacetonicum]NSB45246.1 acetyl esterase/lipase [Clostridium saccharoperbutylacetonicum]